MTTSDECALACYQQVAVISEEHNVYLVQHIVTKEIYIKKILSIYNRDVFCFLQEHHIPGTPEIIEVVEDNTQLIVIEEYISGKTLRSVLDAGGKFTAEQAKDIIIKLCQILSYLHTAEPAIIHRDIKPSNIILTSDGDVKLLDMNTAKFQSENSIRDTVLLGTAGYAAPEQYGFGSSCIQSDIYSLGVLLNEMILGVLPDFMIVDGELGDIIRKCTMMQPQDRYATVDELQDALYPTSESESTKNHKLLPFMIPGFRSRNPINMVLAILGYTFSVLLAFSYSQQNLALQQLRLHKSIILFFILAVIFFSCNYLNIWHTCKINRIKNKYIQVLAVLLADAGIILFMFLAIAIVNS